MISEQLLIATDFATEFYFVERRSRHMAREGLASLPDVAIARCTLASQCTVRRYDDIASCRLTGRLAAGKRYEQNERFPSASYQGSERDPFKVSMHFVLALRSLAKVTLD